MNIVTRRALLATTPLVALPASAQEPAKTSDAAAPVPASGPVVPGAAPVTDRQVFTVADFTRFAPRNGLDMLRQAPGFTIVEGEQLRGLGQASGNVLNDGKRLSSKSDDIFTQLGRIPTGSVVRIEIVDGATFELPGLSGQVGNVIVKASALTGQFARRPQLRAHYARPVLAQGEISVSGRHGPI